MTVIAAVVLIMYAGYNVADHFSDKLEIVDAVWKNVNVTVRADACIFRDETTLYSSADGAVVPAVADGSHVAVYTAVADVYSVSSPEIQSRISEIDAQISLLEKKASSGHSVQSSAGLDAVIYDNIFDIASSVTAGDYGAAVGKRSSLLVSIRNRDIATEDDAKIDLTLAELRNERTSIRSKLGVCLDTVSVSKTGYYYSDADGLGSVFVPSLLDTMTYDDYNELIGGTHETDDRLCVGTLVTSYKWYITCEMSKAEAAALTDASKVPVTFLYSGVTLDMSPYRIISQSGGERAVVVFSCGTMPEGFDYTRIQPVSVRTENYSGYEIPQSALRVLSYDTTDEYGNTETHSFTGVYILDELTVQFRRVNILYKEGGSVIVSGNDAENEEIAELLNRLRSARREELDVRMTYDFLSTQKNGYVMKKEDEDRIYSEAVSQAASEINNDSIKRYYWISENDTVIVSGTGIEKGKTVSGQ